MGSILGSIMGRSAADIGPNGGSIRLCDGPRIRHAHLAQRPPRKGCGSESFSRDGSVPYNGRFVHVLHQMIPDLAKRFNAKASQSSW
ncbi:MULTISPECIES: hypothetical protein [unclassified Bradyrhizobium]|uniref:hypothetical protein n=1 Tax=unclassified Bradyrhizobium TaxID=2631580 RepID=UPI0029162393|nr:MULTISPECIES: hypothetical protein [unclassified Bradyrhizobium]